MPVRSRSPETTPERPAGHPEALPMKAVYLLGGEPLGAEIHATQYGLSPVGPGLWMWEVIRQKPPNMSDREYLYSLAEKHQGYLSVVLQRADGSVIRFPRPKGRSGPRGQFLVDDPKVQDVEPAHQGRAGEEVELLAAQGVFQHAKASQVRRPEEDGQAVRAEGAVAKVEMVQAEKVG
jgi:hypothetical protein